MKTIIYFHFLIALNLTSKHKIRFERFAFERDDETHSTRRANRWNLMRGTIKVQMFSWAMKSQVTNQMHTPIFNAGCQLGNEWHSQRLPRLVVLALGDTEMFNILWKPLSQFHDHRKTIRSRQKNQKMFRQDPGASATGGKLYVDKMPEFPGGTLGKSFFQHKNRWQTRNRL